VGDEAEATLCIDAAETGGTIARFQLAFRPTEGDEPQYLYRSTLHEPRIDGRPVVAGGTYRFRDRDWTVHLDNIREGVRCYICTPVHEQAT